MNYQMVWAADTCSQHSAYNKRGNGRGRLQGNTPPKTQLPPLEDLSGPGTSWWTVGPRSSTVPSAYQPSAHGTYLAVDRGLRARQYSAVDRCVRHVPRGPRPWAALSVPRRRTTADTHRHHQQSPVQARAEPPPPSPRGLVPVRALMLGSVGSVEAPGVPTHAEDSRSSSSGLRARHAPRGVPRPWRAAVPRGRPWPSRVVRTWRRTMAFARDCPEVRAPLAPTARPSPRGPQARPRTTPRADNSGCVAGEHPRLAPLRAPPANWQTSAP